MSIACGGVKHGDPRLTMTRFAKAPVGCTTVPPTAATTINPPNIRQEPPNSKALRPIRSGKNKHTNAIPMPH